MNRFLKYMLVVITAFSAFSCCLAADTVKVYFRVGHSRFEPSFGNNGPTMESFLDKIKSAIADNAVDSIIIRGAASPDGGNKINELLSLRRADAIAGYLMNHTGVSRDLITIIPGGIAWGELRDLVAENPDVPAREKVLDILDNTPVWIYDSKGVIVSGRKKRLMDLNGGRPYNWMYTHLFPELRNAMMIALVLKSDAHGSTDSADSTNTTGSTDSLTAAGTANGNTATGANTTNGNTATGANGLAANN